MLQYTFIITSLIIIITPGTGVIYTIATGITSGKKASIIASFGCTLGIIPHLLASIIGFSFLIQTDSIYIIIFKYIGAIYLTYLGIGMLLSKAQINFYSTNNSKNSASIVTKSILINLLNPKLTLFFFSFLPQYIDENKGDYLSQSLLLGISFMALSLIVFILYGILANSTKVFFTRSPHRLIRIQQIFGLIFILFAVKLAL